MSAKRLVLAAVVAPVLAAFVVFVSDVVLGPSAMSPVVSFEGATARREPDGTWTVRATIEIAPGRWREFAVTGATVKDHAGNSVPATVVAPAPLTGELPGSVPLVLRTSALGEGPFEVEVDHSLRWQGLVARPVLLMRDDFVASVASGS